jgi:hypothetical protein
MVTVIVGAFLGACVGLMIWMIIDAISASRRQSALIAKAKQINKNYLAPQAKATPVTNAKSVTDTKKLKEREEFIEMLRHLIESDSLDWNKARETLDVWDRLHQATNGTPIPDDNPFGPLAPPKTDDTCPECGDQFAMSEDYLCPGCREKMNNA